MLTTRNQRFAYRTGSYATCSLASGDGLLTQRALSSSPLFVCMPQHDVVVGSCVVETDTSVERPNRRLCGQQSIWLLVGMAAISLVLIVLLLVFNQPSATLAHICAALSAENVSSDSTLVHGQVKLGNTTITVLCDGDWVIVQQRLDDSQNFESRSWSEYAHGFGDVSKNGSFWIGNEYLHALTMPKDGMSHDSKLRIELHGDRRMSSQHADSFFVGEYNFKIDDESTNYTIHVSLDHHGPLGNASTGWYDFDSADGQPFSTIDRINDPDPRCQHDYKMGGWWTHNCGTQSLNGIYNHQPTSNQIEGVGLFFLVRGEFLLYPKTTRMLVRSSHMQKITR